jgi:hypothetical protein
MDERPSTYLASLEAAGPDFMNTTFYVPMVEKPIEPVWYLLLWHAYRPGYPQTHTRTRRRAVAKTGHSHRLRGLILGPISSACGRRAGRRSARICVQGADDRARIQARALRNEHV